MKRLSSLAIRFDTERKLPTGIDLRHWHVQEFLAFVFVIVMVYLFANDILGLGTLGHVYLQMVAMFFFNSIRTVVAHRYMNKGGAPMTFADQLLDSVNIDGNPIVCELIAPVGLRYHGLHHLFPAIPYHNLGIVHRRMFFIFRLVLFTTPRLNQAFSQPYAPIGKTPKLRHWIPAINQPKTW